jgi:hypothetical protein
MKTALSEIVLARADRDCLPADHSLRKFAAEFDTASETCIKEPVLENTKKMLGAWARLRKQWAEYSGEPVL